jgi:hypothetical protein
MSTRIGSLEAPRMGRSIWPAAIIASLVMLTIGLATFTLGRGDAARTTAPDRTVSTPTVVSGTQANTPTELRAATAGAGVAAVRIAPHVPRRAAGTATGSSDVDTAVNTPSELSGGVVQTFIDTTVRDEPIMVNGHICGQCG